MKTLIILLTLLLGILLGAFGVILVQDCKESERKIQETRNHIKQLNERIENEKRNFYQSLQARK